MRDPTAWRWDRTCRYAGATEDGAISAALGDILARHSEPQRHHHTIEHVAEVTQTIRALGDPRLPVADTALAPESYSAACLAGWLHDVVYDPTSATNEADSAEYASRCLATLGIDEWITGETARLILATATHEVTSQDGAGMVLMDADLAILAARRKRYDRYASAIRAEYPHLDDATYAAGRATILRGFLDRGSLYYCEQMVTRCDEAARQNLRRELDSLTLDPR